MMIEVDLTEYRYGFLRAAGSTEVPIYFGIALMLIAGLLMSMRGFTKSFLINPISIVAALLGALASLSSGPWIASALLVFFHGFAKRTNLIKPALILLAFVAIFLEVASNRHFYHLIDYVAINKQTAWYRTRLLEVAVSRWQEFWLFGVGGNSVNHWASLIDGRKHVDIVNHFVIIALYGGFVALIFYVLSHVIAIRSGISAWKQSGDTTYRDMMFSLMAALPALDLTSLSVGLFGPALLLSYILLGFLVSASGWSLDNGNGKIT
jgi:hypothetical protein